MDPLSRMNSPLSMSTPVPMTPPLPGVLWISGVTACLTWVAGHLLPFKGEAFDTAAYLFLATLIPLVTLVLARLSAGSGLKYLLVGAMLFICFEGLVRTKDLLSLLLFFSLTWVPVKLIKVARPRSPRIELTVLGMRWLGHGPDWYGFIEYVLIYVGGGMGSIVADWQGPVSFILGMFAIVVAASRYF